MNSHRLSIDSRVRRAALESLEYRRLLSASLHNGILRVVGTDKADQITLDLNPADKTQLRVRVNDTAPAFFKLADVRRISAAGLGGSDRIVVDSANGAVTVKLVASGGNGNDSIVGGAGNDAIEGGRGQDQLRGGDGNDLLAGGAGDDKLFGEGGRDTLIGGAGKDLITTGAGKDDVRGVTGADAVDKGAAAEVISQKKLRFSGTPIIGKSGARGQHHVFNASVVGYTPQQMRHAYELGDLSSKLFKNRGAGQTIAIVDAFDYPTARQDLNTFSDAFGLPHATKANFGVVYASGHQPLSDPGWAGEAALDIQWAHAIAPEAKIILVEADSALNVDIYAAVERAVELLQPTGGVVSMSFGSGEGAFFAFQDFFKTFQTGNVSFVASAGDRPGELAFPSISEEVLSVGGTFAPLDAAGNFTGPETAWSSGGGGASTVQDRPGYQDQINVGGSVIGNDRVVPDVAYNADPLSGVAVFSTTPNTLGDTGWQAVGGTSAGAPQWAGIVALANEKRMANGLDILGNGQLNNYIYGIAKKYGPAVFNDITTGDNSHPATAGFDEATGWGTPRAAELIDQLAVAQARNRVGTDTSMTFKWKANFVRSLQRPLPPDTSAVTNFYGDGTGTFALGVAGLNFVGTSSTGLLTITGTTTRVGNTVEARGTASVLLNDGTPGNFLVALEARLFRVNGQDKIIGKFYSISSRGKILQQGPQAILRGEFASDGDFEGPPGSR